jgi:hypothetical protein
MEGYKEWMLDLVNSDLLEDSKINLSLTKIYPEVVPCLKKCRQPFDSQDKKRQIRYTRIDAYKQQPTKDLWFYWINEVENCPLYFSVFHEMILDGTIENYDSDMMGRYSELMERFDGGQLNAEEYSESMKNDFPDQGKSTFR